MMNVDINDTYRLPASLPVRHDAFGNPSARTLAPTLMVFVTKWFRSALNYRYLFIYNNCKKTVLPFFLHR